MIRAVLFDCDGVLADSETLSNRIVAEEITALGWVLDGHAAQREFLGLSLPDMLPIIERRVGPVPEGWGLALSHRIAREMEIGVTAMPGASTVVECWFSRGNSWISRPTPCPVPCPNRAPCPARLPLTRDRPDP